MNQVLYLDPHILDICATLQDLLQADHQHIVFTTQTSFHRLLTHIFTLDLDVSQYPALHDVITDMEDSDNVCDAHDTQDHKI